MPWLHRLVSRGARRDDSVPAAVQRRRCAVVAIRSLGHRPLLRCRTGVRTRPGAAARSSAAAVWPATRPRAASGPCHAFPRFGSDREHLPHTSEARGRRAAAALLPSRPTFRAHADAGAARPLPGQLLGERRRAPPKPDRSVDRVGQGAAGGVLPGEDRTAIPPCQGCGLHSASVGRCEFARSCTDALQPWRI